MKIALFVLITVLLAAPAVMAADGQDTPEILGNLAYRNEVVVMDDAALAGVQGTCIPKDHPPLIQSLIVFKMACPYEKLMILKMHIEYLFGGR
ncbi:MAG: hypothetical protein JXB13_14590 [Phycisphaerae bacterium]|nr:hypothetical protein [Phycisphaerae bacterium]